LVHFWWIGGFRGICWILGDFRLEEKNFQISNFRNPMFAVKAFTISNVRHLMFAAKFFFFSNIRFPKFVITTPPPPHTTPHSLPAALMITTIATDHLSVMESKWCRVFSPGTHLQLTELTIHPTLIFMTNKESHSFLSSSFQCSTISHSVLFCWGTLSWIHTRTSPHINPHNE
jgi:hypothetical protein